MRFALRLPDNEPNPQQLINALKDCGFTVTQKIGPYLLLDASQLRERWGDVAPDATRLLTLTGGRYWIL